MVRARHVLFLSCPALLVGCRGSPEPHGSFADAPAGDRSKPALNLPAEWTFDLTRDVPITFLLIPAGAFEMGSPESESGRDPDESLHRVRIGRSFYLSPYEITQAQWRAVRGENPSRFQGDGQRPVDSVTWDQAESFCRRLSERIDRVARLPTEAEWEYACRAGTTTPFAFGATLTRHDANFDWTGGVAVSAGLVEQTVPVGRFAPNAWGLYDMHGNVREWCADWYGADYDSAAPAVDPGGPASGSMRVLRGGAWEDYARRCRSAYRHGYKPGDRPECIGFRVCLDPRPRK